MVAELLNVAVQVLHADLMEGTYQTPLPVPTSCPPWIYQTLIIPLPDADVHHRPEAWPLAELAEPGSAGTLRLFKGCAQQAYR